MSRLASFEDYRQRILAIVAIAEAKITPMPPSDTADLDNARVRMARVLTAYHLFAEREVFTPCTYALRDPAHKAQVKAVAAECAALAHDFRRFTRDYQERPAIGRWSSYYPAAQALIARIRRHMMAAEREVKRCTMLGINPALCRAA